ncbi:MAG: FtsX-like permease family protein [Phycisphaerales bacterium]|nr:FtsX-like permease family protein [Phycisphaerales bacterium]
MNRSALLRRNLVFHWRAHLAVALGVVVASAVLTGALLVGDSMRASLRETALGRLGNVDLAVSSPRFFREALANTVASVDREVAPIIIARGAAHHATTHARANAVGVFGVDGRFWAMHGPQTSDTQEMPDGRQALLNRALADELGAQPGDAVILSLGKPQDVATDTLLGRRDDTTTAVRLTVARIIEDRDLATFDLRPRQTTPKNVFIPLSSLQRVLDQPGKVNTLLAHVTKPDADMSPFGDALAEHLTLADFGLSLRVDAKHNYVALETDAFLIAPEFEQAAIRAATVRERNTNEAANSPDPVHIEPILAYLANEIAAGEKAIPYSTVAAIDPNGATIANMQAKAGNAKLAPGEILLNEWAANDLDAKIGDKITLTYYVTGAFGRLETKQSTFTLAGIVALTGSADDPGFTPPYPGVTDVERIADWDPPFPVDLKKLRDRDETYWDEHRTTPKAFVSLADGERLWAEDSARFGKYTALRVTCAATDVETLKGNFQTALRAELSPASGGFAVQNIRQAAESAGQGSTDFSGLFIGFSFFLIAAAAMLVALLFRLGVERRAYEVGLMLAVGHAQRSVSRLLLAEGAIVGTIGAVIGVFAGVGYAQLMLAGLRSWWSAAVNAPFLFFAGAPQSYAIGLVATIIVAILALAWGMRNMRRCSANQLLAGNAEAASTPRDGKRKRSWSPVLAIVSLVAALALIGATYVTDAVSPTMAFFGGGSAMLVAGLATAAFLLRSHSADAVDANARRALTRLGLRNAPRHPGRSLLIVALIASATFITTSLQAFRIEAGDTTDLHGGAGGFALIAQAASPLPYDLNTPDGRTALNITDGDALAGVTCMPFRLRPGDAASCTNLYLPSEPRILGAPCAMIHRGGFSFSQVDAETPEQRENPWTLLDRELPGGVIPVIGDEAAVLWQMHLGLGKHLTVNDDAGNAHELQFVALLKGSSLQDEVIIAEDRFTQLFPSISGHAFFLVEASAEKVERVTHVLESDLEPYGVDVVTSRERLNEYFAIQNTYLSTFQMLGGLGVLLGSVGLIAVMLRNVWERRSELALMRALGFTQGRIAWVLLVENGVLVAGGLLIGTVAAVIAIAPRILEDPTSIAWGAVLLLLAGVPVLGIGVAAVVLARVLRMPLLPALRRE